MSGVFKYGKKFRSKTAVKVFGFCALVLLILIAAVHFTNNAIYINRILIDRMDGHGPLTRAQVRQWVRDEILSQSKMRIDEKEDGSITLRVILSPAHVEDNSGIDGLEIRMILEDQENPNLETGVVSLIPKKEQNEEKIRRALQTALGNLHVQFEAKRSDGFDVEKIFQAYLAGKRVSREMLVLAIERAKSETGFRHQNLLVSILPKADLEISVRILSALGSNGSEEAIPAIFDFAENKGTEIRRQAIEAVRKIGGEKAAAWLFTLSTGHPDERVRDTAMLALSDVEKRLNESVVRK